MPSKQHASSQTKARLSSSLITALLFSSGVALTGLSGCSYIAPYKAPVTQGNVMTEESLGLLQEGLNQEQVRKLLGPPMGQNAFNPYHWEYIFYTTDENSNLSQKKHLVLEFDRNKFLEKWSVKEAVVDMVDEETFFGL